MPETKIADAVRQTFSLTPRGIIDHLELQKPGYINTAAYGHFGRNEFSWEKTDKVEALKSSLSL